MLILYTVLAYIKKWLVEAKIHVKVCPFWPNKWSLTPLTHEVDNGKIHF